MSFGRNVLIGSELARRLRQNHQFVNANLNANLCQESIVFSLTLFSQFSFRVFHQQFRQSYPQPSSSFVTMAAVAPFTNTLRNVCGLSQPAANAIVAQGFSNPGDFIPLEDTNIDSLVKHTIKANAGAVAIPYLSVVKIKAFRYWALIRQRIGMNFDSAHFDAAELVFIQDLMRERRDRQAAAQTDPEKPPEFSDMADWRAFWEKFNTYMSQTYGAAEIPLTYVYREHEAVTNEMRIAAYADNDTRYYTITVLTGSHYREDNKRVYEELKLTMINGPGWTFIKRFERTQDGRSAVLAIKQQAEGRSAIDTRKQQAYAQIATARYAGPRRNWNFQRYVERHQGGHNELLDLNEPVPETKKVTDFMAGITDPRLANAKDIILGTPQYLQNFEACQQYLATLVSNKAEQSKMERQISQLETHRPGGKNGGKGSGKKLHPGRYPPKEWNKLSKAEKAKVRALRDAQKEEKERLEAAKRKAQVAQIDTDSGAPEDQGAEGTTQEQFGRAAHKRSKKD